MATIIYDIKDIPEILSWLKTLPTDHQFPMCNNHKCLGTAFHQYRTWTDEVVMMGGAHSGYPVIAYRLWDPLAKACDGTKGSVSAATAITILESLLEPSMTAP